MAQLILCRLKINLQGQGFGEQYYFKDDITTHVAAIPLAKQIAFGRTAFFGTGCELIYASVSLIGPGPDKETIPLDYPLGPHPSWTGGNGPGDTIAAPEDPQTCVQQIFQADGGKWSNRYYHGCPDNWLNGKRLSAGILQYWQPAADNGQDPVLDPTGGLNHLGVCRGFWRYLMRRCVQPRKVTPINYTPINYRDILFGQVTSKKVGKSFRASRGRRPSTLIA